MDIRLAEKFAYAQAITEIALESIPERIGQEMEPELSAAVNSFRNFMAIDLLAFTQKFMDALPNDRKGVMMAAVFAELIKGLAEELDKSASQSLIAAFVFGRNPEAFPGEDAVEERVAGHLLEIIRRSEEAKGE